jgi:hypothetical protein
MKLTANDVPIIPQSDPIQLLKSKIGPKGKIKDRHEVDGNWTAWKFVLRRSGGEYLLLEERYQGKDESNVAAIYLDSKGKLRVKDIHSSMSVPISEYDEFQNLTPDNLYQVVHDFLAHNIVSYGLQHNPRSRKIPSEFSTSLYRRSEEFRTQRKTENPYWRDPRDEEYD